jgi:site-specific recombinase XerD
VTGVTTDERDVETPDADVVVELDELDQQLVGQLVGRARSQGLRLTGQDGLLAQLTKTIIESAAERFGKGAKGSGPRPRWVPMLDGLDLVLRWYLNDVRGRFPDSPVSLCDESGGRMAAATIRNRLRHLLALEGRPESDWFSPHGMRRAYATHNYERGVDLLAIQQLLGHWTVASTMRYVRPSETFIEDAYQRAISATLSELTRQE